MWMSGFIEVEGAGKPAIHPKLGIITQNAKLRRSMNDFPPLAWFTSRIDIPRCILNAELRITDDNGDEVAKPNLPNGWQNLVSLNRMALGFRKSDL